MKRETMIWSIVLLLGVALLAMRSLTGDGMGKAYVKANENEFVNVAPDGDDPKWVDVNGEDSLDYNIEGIGDDKRISWTQFDQASPKQWADAQAKNANQTTYRFSFWRTFGIWISAFFTLAIFSFLYKDNPLYKIAEAVVVGVSAAYWMVVGFWEVLVPNLFGKLAPDMVKGWAMPGLGGDAGKQDLWFIVPLILGVMLLWRLAPKGAWIARWPLAFIVGTTAGIRLIGFIQADFLSQVRNGIVPLYVKTAQYAADGSAMVDAAGAPVMGFDLWESLRNIILIVGVLACIVYFFFSFEHKGVVGHTARLGIWFLMITFGAAFGYTVMGRIALLAIRLEFLFDDWLWLIDPTGKRAVEATTSWLWPMVMQLQGVL